MWARSEGKRGRLFSWAAPTDDLCAINHAEQLTSPSRAEGERDLVARAAIARKCGGLATRFDGEVPSTTY